PRFGIGAIAFGTILTSFLALVMAVPVALGIALCLSHYAPARLASALGFLVDLLAAVPSVVFGLWGRDSFYKPVTDLSAWLLARALGETIALALTLGSVNAITFDLIGPGGNTIAANIANKFGEAGETGQSALIASGLVLFAITMVVNMTARAIIFRRREFVGS